MQILPTNRFASTGRPTAGQKRPALPAKLPHTVAPQTAGGSGGLKAQVEAQKKRHLSFLTHVRESMAFLQEEMKEAGQLIGKYQDFPQAEFQEIVQEAQKTLPELEDMMEELQQMLDKGLEENAFIMGTLEALHNEDGKFPVHTLEAYLQKRDEEQSGAEEKPTGYRKYTLEDVDRMIVGLKAELGTSGFSAQA